MRQINRHVRTVVGPLSTAALVAVCPPAHGDHLSARQRIEMEVSGRVDRELIEALERDGRAGVIVLLEVRDGPGELLRSVRTSATRGALGRTADSVLAGVPRDRFELAYRYRALNSLAGATDAEGVLALLDHGAVAGVGLDDTNRWSLAEAIPLAGIKPVQRRAKHGKNVWVALLDSGVDTDHRDLRKRIKAQECFCGPSCCPDGSARQSGKGSAEDDVGHGTLVAGAILSRGKDAPRGAAMKAKLLAMKVGDAVGPKDSDILAALDFVLTEMPQVRVLNMSFGGNRFFKSNCDKRGATNRAYAQAINALYDEGILAIAASGNAGNANKMPKPACIKNAVSVGAVYDDFFGEVEWGACTDASSAPNELVCFTDRSKRTDLVAPGALITSSRAGGGTASVVGTSFSSPLAVGCATLLRKAFPDATPAEVKAALTSSSTRAGDPSNSRSYPVLDCEEAFDFLADL